jgi:hypothetical protein
VSSWRLIGFPRMPVTSSARASGPGVASSSRSAR